MPASTAPWRCCRTARCAAAWRCSASKEAARRLPNPPRRRLARPAPRPVDARKTPQVRSRGLILTTSALAGMPVLTLLVLAATGAALPGPALIAAVLTVLTAFCIALLWARDLDLLSETVRHAVAPELTPPPVGTPVLPPMD